jgi:dolichol-phosphate mannosyltransferase
MDLPHDNRNVAAASGEGSFTPGSNILYIVVPVLNEESNIPQLIEAFRDIHDRFTPQLETTFLLIDDGSSDGSGRIALQMAEGLRLRVIRHEKTRGPGRAFATGFAYLASRLGPNDWVATMEGDNTSRPEILGQMFVRSREGYDVILASPYQYGGGIEKTSGLRVILSHVANGFLKSFIGLHGFLTMSSFFRLHRGAAILRLQSCFGPEIIERSGFEGVVEMLIKMTLLRITISEVAMVLDTSRRMGKSKMRLVRTICGYLTLYGDRGRWVSMATDYLGRSLSTEATAVLGE